MAGQHRASGYCALGAAAADGKPGGDDAGAGGAADGGPQPDAGAVGGGAAGAVAGVRSQRGHAKACCHCRGAAAA